MSEDIEVLVSGRTEGPVQAEILVLRLLAGRIELVGPCGPDPWYVEVPDDEDPVGVVDRMCRTNLGEPLLVHSTSWRRSRDGVFLTFVVVMPDNFLPIIAGVPVRRAEMARSDPTAAPRKIDPGQVIEHGLRHLQWLVGDDPAVRRTLSAEWKSILRTYQSEPFRHLRS